jgi:hypothetical protein
MKKYLNHASLGLPRCPKKGGGFFCVCGVLASPARVGCHFVERQCL